MRRHQLRVAWQLREWLLCLPGPVHGRAVSDRAGPVPVRQLRLVRDVHPGDGPVRVLHRLCWHVLPDEFVHRSELQSWYLSERRMRLHGCLERTHLHELALRLPELQLSRLLLRCLGSGCVHMHVGLYRHVL